jgi:hypothetical protein
MKELLQFYGHGMSVYPVLITAIYVLLCNKANVVKFNNVISMIIYIMLLASSFIFSYVINFKVISIWINQRLYGINAGILGIYGRIEDIVITSIVLFPLFVILHRVFKVKSKTRLWSLIYFVVYLLLNISVIFLYESSLRTLINYG